MTYNAIYGCEGSNPGSSGGAYAPGSSDKLPQEAILENVA
jgi:hypothetical protein